MDMAKIDLYPTMRKHVLFGGMSLAVLLCELKTIIGNHLAQKCDVRRAQKILLLDTVSINAHNIYVSHKKKVDRQTEGQTARLTTTHFWSDRDQSDESPISHP